MKIPLSWLREYVTIPAKLTAEQIAQAFVKVGFEVEQLAHFSLSAGPVVAVAPQFRGHLLDGAAEVHDLPGDGAE